jgi:hypothetical protein
VGNIRECVVECKDFSMADKGEVASISRWKNKVR